MTKKKTMGWFLYHLNEAVRKYNSAKPLGNVVLMTAAECAKEEGIYFEALSREDWHGNPVLTAIVAFARNDFEGNPILPEMYMHQAYEYYVERVEEQMRTKTRKPLARFRSKSR